MFRVECQEIKCQEIKCQCLLLMFYLLRSCLLIAIKKFECIVLSLRNIMSGDEVKKINQQILFVRELMFDVDCVERNTFDVEVFEVVH